jgi:hypothetical protein
MCITQPADGWDNQSALKRSGSEYLNVSVNMTVHTATRLGDFIDM